MKVALYTIDDLHKAEVKGYTRVRMGKMERVDPFTTRKLASFAGEKKAKTYKSSDFKVEVEIDHPDFEESRSVAVVDFHIEPGSTGGQHEPSYNPSVEDAVYVCRLFFGR